MKECAILGKIIRSIIRVGEKTINNMEDRKKEGDTTKVFIAAFISFNEASDSAFYASEASQESAFIWAKALDSKQVMQDLGFNAFPHVTYINKEGKVVYNGFLSNRPWIFAYHPRKFLNL